jgi:thioester reductase-like protein
MEDGVLLTGATGFVGMEVLYRYLVRTDRTIYVPVRASDDAAAKSRISDTLASLFSDADAYAEQWVAVAGDVTQPGLGLSSKNLDWLAEQVTDVLHCAASVSFSLPLEQARNINVEGTEHVLDFAQLCHKRGGLRKFSYVSTAYVAGKHRGYFTEDQLDLGQSFRNSYERSKFEAEQKVWQRCDDLPVQVFRPSIVVGDRTSGFTASFNVLYWPIRAFSLGAYKAIPARRQSPVDVVPVDYVADAVFELSDRPPAEDRTYHLTAANQATTVGNLMDMTRRHFDRSPPKVINPTLYRWLIHPLLRRRAKGVQRKALEQSLAYFPYFWMRVVYDDQNARAALEPAGVSMSPLEHYFDRLIDFANATRWGRRPMGRAEALARV